MNRRMLGGVLLAAVLIVSAACSGGGEPAEPASGEGARTEAESREPEPTPAETGPEAEKPQREPAASAAPAPSLESFAGLSGSDGVFSMHVNEAYADEDGVITDGRGTTDHAAEASEFVIFNVQITNESSTPASFTWGGSYAYDVAGNQYADDYDAAWAACDTYCSDDLNPGGTAETDVVFEMPPDTGIVSLELRSDPSGTGSAAIIEP
ncbi:DUF4352 domain-containing protein [Streptomonospora algeriensis]|uniref:DUF4352 domain-containing protein n=1 Tax=Streptomonospora algeriensis TaxID=995084 RepID=A0ABW3BEN7_9ACTN